MSKDDIEKARKDAEANADEDKKKREAIDAKNQLENAIYQAEKMPDEFKDKISDEDKENIKKAVEEAKKALGDAGADKEALEKATKELNDRIMPIGAKMYQQKTEEAGSPEGGEADKKDGSDEAVEGEVVDK
jgi:molecular chaperone DnaK